MANESEASVPKEEAKKKGKTLEEQLEAAKERVRQIQARKQRKEAREKTKVSKAERAKDTRKKILLGALVLARVARGDWTQDNLDDLTNELTRDDDRALFGLLALQTQTAK